MPPIPKPLPVAHVLSASLDHVELTSREDKRLSELTFRHSGWARERAAVLAAFEGAAASDLRVARFENCGSYAWVLRSKEDPTIYRISSSHCHDRFCKPCQRSRANRLAHRLLAASPTTDLRFVTLTLRHSPLPLSLQLQKLVACFRTLRRQHFWAARTTGGAAFIEVKRSKDGKYWHPHLHIIHHGRYLPHRDLSLAWSRLTRGSYIVHINRVRNLDRVAAYVTAYATKPFDSSLTHDHAALVEAIRALHGRRQLITFGTWRTLASADSENPRDGWELVAPLWELLARADHGDPDAIDTLTHLRRSVPCLNNHDPPNTSHLPSPLSSDSQSPDGPSVLSAPSSSPATDSTSTVTMSSAHGVQSPATVH